MIVVMIMMMISMLMKSSQDEKREESSYKNSVGARGDVCISHGDLPCPAESIYSYLSFTSPHRP